MRFFIIIFCLLYSNLLFSQKFFIEVVVPNIPSIKGEIQIGLYNNSATFPKVGKEFKTYRYKVTKKRMKFKLTNKILDYIWVKGLEYKDAYVWSELEGADHKAMTATLRVK